MTEDQLEQETLSWLINVGYNSAYGPDIAVDGSMPEIEAVKLNHKDLTSAYL